MIKNKPLFKLVLFCIVSYLHNALFLANHDTQTKWLRNKMKGMLFFKQAVLRFHLRNA